MLFRTGSQWEWVTGVIGSIWVGEVCRCERCRGGYEKYIQYKVRREILREEKGENGTPETADETRLVLVKLTKHPSTPVKNQYLA